ncbi:hypothetical protein [Sphingomonas endophytica]|nr:hypothetical protein [Sphingomonas endophytica]
MHYKNEVLYVEDEELDRLFPEPSCSIPISSILSPVLKIERSLSLLKREMKKGFRGELSPAIHVMSADCGTGKTTALQKALRGWKADGFRGDGAIIFLRTLEEIDPIVTGTGLDHADYAVFTSDEKYKTYGAGRSAANRVPVLFISQVMARKMMLIAGDFAAVTDLHYYGKIRALRVWDEGFAAAEGAVFDLVDLHALPSAFKALPRADRDMLWSLIERCAEPFAGLALDIPLSIIDTVDRVLKGGLKVADAPKRTLEALGKLAGSTAYLRGNDYTDWTFLGAGRSLPADIRPLIVLDASARLTSRYKQLPAHGMNVIELEPALLAYDRVAVHWCNLAAGKTALRNPAQRAIIYGTIADLVNSKRSEDFLIVIAKDACGGGDGPVALPKELNALLSDPDRMRVTSWGRHIGTNEYRDIPNVIIVSAYNYGDDGYDALALAASGSRDGIVSKEERRDEAASAFMHNVYQAVCRSRVRQRDGALAGAANVYLIMKDSDQRREQITRAFPGCSIDVWMPCTPIKQKHDLVLHTLFAIMETQNSVSFNALTEACGGSGHSYLTKVVKTERFKGALQSKGIERVGNSFQRKLRLTNAA